MHQYFSHYHSIFGLTVLIDRPTLRLGKVVDGAPRTVNYNDRVHYLNIKGIAVADYKRLQPDLVIFRLADGTLLAAPKTAHEAIDPGESQTFGQSYNMPVSYLQLLSHLPAEMPEELAA